VGVGIAEGAEEGLQVMLVRVGVAVEARKSIWEAEEGAEERESEGP
jgi:hypothetical protein